MFRVIFLELLKLVLRLLAIAVGIRVPSHKQPILALPWGNHWKLFGHHYPYLRVYFMPASRVRYGWQEITLEPWPVPDFPNVRPISEAEQKGQAVICVILAHTLRGAQAAISYWQKSGFTVEEIVVVYGGRETDFTELQHGQKFHVNDVRLRVNPAPSKKQSYQGVFRAVAPFLLARKEVGYVLFVEYDLIPIWGNIKERLVELISGRGADGLFAYLCRVDQTNAPHYLYHLSDPNFERAWEKISRREEKRVVLQAFGACSFLTREAWLAYAEVQIPTQIYLEIEIPTTLHHLGFRVRPFPHVWCQYLTVGEITKWKLQQAKRDKAPWVHPIKV
ncbi:MAG: hypothetical protein N2035_03390 [Chthoniobacterales bacterium]|nr:hypothetical protein [Chthoniobacterales bacterium]MCX7712698.1 hypothetical protein [Chthoniobacterales bacterium]